MSLSLSKSFQSSPCGVIYYAPDGWAAHSQLFKLWLSADAARSVKAPRSMEWPGNCVTLDAAGRPLRVWRGHPLSGYVPTGRQTLLHHAVHTARAVVLLDGEQGRVTGAELLDAVTYAREMGVSRVVLWHDGHDPARLLQLARSAGYPERDIVSVPTRLKAALRCRCLRPGCEDCRPVATLQAALATERAVSTRVLLPVEGTDHIAAFGLRAGAFVVWWPRGETRPLPLASGALIDVVTASAVHRLPVAEVAPEAVQGGSWGPGMVFQTARDILFLKDVVGVVSPDVGAGHLEKLALLRRYQAGELVRF